MQIPRSEIDRLARCFYLNALPTLPTWMIADWMSVESDSDITKCLAREIYRRSGVEN